jgi:hypothetical protein
MPSNLSPRDPVVKTEKGFCSSARAEKKTLSDFESLSRFAQKSVWKMTG